MTALGDIVDTSTVARAVLPVLGSTILLTASFLGVLSLLTNQTSGFSDRFPIYVLVMAIGFVTALFILERPSLEGTQILVVTLGLTVTIFVTVTLAGEGINYAIQHPEDVFDPDLILYLVAAALIGSGLAFWSVRHWREYASNVR